MRGIVVRYKDLPISTDEAVNELWDALTTTANFYLTVFGRNWWNNAGDPIYAAVHLGQDYIEAHWDGGGLEFGDCDGHVMTRFIKCIEAVAHEFTHGVVDRTAKLLYADESGALNESMADVFGSMVKQWSKTPKQRSVDADWLIAQAWKPPYQHFALRSLKAPGTAFGPDEPTWGQDNQPSSYDKYVHLPKDRDHDMGGVHTNSGIPNHAFYLVAIALGGYSWERAGQIWYKSLLDPKLKNNATFKEFADITLDHAAAYGTNVVETVRSAWTTVKVYTKPPEPPSPFTFTIPKTSALTYRLTGGTPGIFDFKSNIDQMIAFDWDGFGKRDHLVVYRPGQGLVIVVKPVNGAFTTVFKSSEGLPDFDLRFTQDRLIAYDYDGSRRLDHLIAYRPGKEHGNYVIFKNVNNSLEKVASSLDGFGMQFPLDHDDDQLVAFDHEGDGKVDDIVAYRPGTGLICVFVSEGFGNFRNVFRSLNGIGSCDLKSKFDRLFAFDYSQSGKLDHLVGYHASDAVKATGDLWVCRNDRASTKFPTVCHMVLKDREFFNIAYDHEGSGKLDHVLSYGVTHRGGKKDSGFRLTKITEKGGVKAVWENLGLLTVDVYEPTLRLCCFDYDSMRKMNALAIYNANTVIPFFAVVKSK